MNKKLNLITILLAAFGAITGGISTYINYTHSEFKKPIDLRAATSSSFIAQIESATKRGDGNEVLRVRLELERYEETWRNNLKLASLTSAVTNLVSLKLKPENNAQIIEILKYADAYVATGSVEPVILGSAYLATGDYKSAVKYLEVAAIKNPKDANIYALRSLALQGKAQMIDFGSERDKLLMQSKLYSIEASIQGIEADLIKTLSTELKVNN